MTRAHRRLVEQGRKNHTEDRTEHRQHTNLAGMKKKSAVKARRIA